MCGIWLNIGDPRGNAPLAGMHHRGPDAEDFRAFDLAGRTVELGHLRLSIIDLDARSNQPMQRDDLWIVFNGEIYNFVELRAELETLGQSFRTRSDTEVLLAAYAAWGTAMLSRLRGMFAFALLDRRKQIVMLARDPFGIKPLFVARTANGLAAASEIAPLLEVPGVSRRSRPAAVLCFLERGESDAGASTFFADIDSLPPAHYAIVALDRPSRTIEPVRYWKPVYDASLSDAAEATGLVRDQFMDSVRLHLRADVPLGTMLSGGIDSSAIVAAVRHLLGADAEMHTFSFISPGEPHDESAFIRLMAGVARTVPHELQAGPEAFVADIETLVRHQGEPFGSTSIYAQYKVAEAARAAGVKVLLDGQGSDELFAGYRFYLGARIAGLLAAGEPIRAAQLLSRVRRLPGVRLGSALYHTLASLDLPVTSALTRRAQAANGPGRLIDPRWRRDHEGTTVIAARGPRRLALLHRLADSLERDVLPGLLRFEDRNTMAFSIEARVPFLDVPLAETACRLAPELLVDDAGTTKSVLRAALRGLVPDAILDRRDKIGFATPEARWLRAAAPWVEAELFLASAAAVPFLNLDRTRAALRSMLSGATPWQPWGWRILSLLIWTRLYRIDHSSL